MNRTLDSLTDVSRRALESAFRLARSGPRAPYAVDGTAGNGHDTLFLASSVGPGGRIWAFDIQEKALASAEKRLAEADAASGERAAQSRLLDRVTFVRAGHESLAGVLPEDAFGNVWGAMFNLGYLPGGDKTVVTRAATTIAALEALLPRVPRGGVVSVHGYMGHAGGEAETEAVSAWFAALSWDEWRVATYAFANKKHNPETLFLAERVA